MKKNKKIILIGPVYPYKGGISHYTGLLYRALAKRFLVKMISYKMQYPKFLFKKEQKDFSNDAFKVEGTQYEIHTANPINWLMNAWKIKKEKPDMVLVQWWHPYFAPCYYVMSLFFKKTKLLYLCHNVFPHERFFLDKFLVRLVLKRGDYFILHSKMEAKELLSIKKDPQYKVNVHPTYNAFQFQNMSKEKAREMLGRGREEKLLLFFGFIRPYKGLSHLLKAMGILKEQKKLKEIKLLIVGDFAGAREEYENLIEENEIREEVWMKDGYTPDKEVEPYFAACDVVVLPYESATQSGIVQIAYGFEKPVIVTKVGGLPEAVEHKKTGFIVEPKSPKALAQSIENFFEGQWGERFKENIRAEAYRFSWDKMADVVESFISSS